MSTAEKIPAIPVGDTEVYCIGCGHEWVEHDENGKPIRWNICHFCPHRQPWHLPINDKSACDGGRS